MDIYAYTYTYMANATIYIHQDNEEAWEKIPNKSEWVNDMLSPPKEKKFVSQAKIRNAEYSTKTREVTELPSTCKNGHVIPTGRDKCTWKGCKYA